MSSSTSTWSSLFHGEPNTTPPSRLYTEEAVQNEQLTADQVVDRAQSSASLLFEMVVSLSEDSETIKSFENNDIIQTLHQDCQEMSDYLTDRIWTESDQHSSYYASSSSVASSSRRAQKTADEEAQIAAFISCQEQIQSALKRYNELKDFLKARELQEEEDRNELAYRASHPYDEEEDLNTVAAVAAAATRAGHGPLHNNHRPYLNYQSSNTYAAAVAELEGDVGDLYDEPDTGHGNHLRRSEQSRVWKLDPREDFTASQRKMKKGVSVEEKKRLELERRLEKGPLNGIHGMVPDPTLVTPDMLTLDDATKDDDLLREDEKAKEEVKAKAIEEEEEEEKEAKKEEVQGTSRTENIAAHDAEPAMAVLEVGEAGSKIDNRSEEDEKEYDEKNQGVEAEEEDESGALSDDSWEEVPKQGQGPYIEGNASAASSTSSFTEIPSSYVV
ncbi:MAG: hypothetical protein J3Q66DRAFT_348824 [Benniella sp.]|nr:MAG: hypothetical protein J3Q66DRAFT_348824 [Benniella sp.]